MMMMIDKNRMMVFALVVLVVLLIGLQISSRTRPADKPAAPAATAYTEFVPDAGMGPVVRIGKEGKIEIRKATEAEYREAVGNLASTVVQLGTQLDQLRNPKKAEGPPPGVYPDHTGLEPVTKAEEKVPPAKLPLDK